MRKNAFHFLIKALVVLKIFKFLSLLVGHVEKTAMTSQPSQQISTIHILPNISWHKGNQIIECGQLVDYNKRKVKNHTENDAGRLVQDLFLFFKKPLNEVKASGL